MTLALATKGVLENKGDIVQINYYGQLEGTMQDETTLTGIIVADKEYSGEMILEEDFS